MWTWEPLPPCSDCGDLTKALNQRLSTLTQYLTLQEKNVHVLDLNNSVCFDGRAGREGVTEAWTTIRDGAGTASDHAAADFDIDAATSSNVALPWNRYRRGFINFRSFHDNGSVPLLPAPATLLGASLDLKLNTMTNDLSLTVGSVGFTEGTTANITTLVDADYQAFQGDDLTERIQVSDFVNGSRIYRWHFNAYGLAYLARMLQNSTTIKLCMRFSWDIDGVGPTFTWADSKQFNLVFQSKDFGGVETRNPPNLRLIYRL